MAIVICDMSVSLDGYVTGPNDSRENPFGDGATVMQQALPLGLVDEFRLHLVPVLVGGGTPLFAGLAEAVSLQRTDVVATPGATHLRFSV
ncbi:MAG: dihydrofolate reductase family protein [Actinomycetota bacterium]|nr:dihydrofolate reductase family protein [Actinomycetota bacterium]